MVESAEDYIQVQPDSTGKKLRAVKSNIGGHDVYNEGVIVVDATDPTRILVVDAAGKIGVSSLPSLPAGTNTIGKLAANSGVDIGDVDVTSVIPGTAATNLGKAEDALHSSGDVGVMLLGVRNDTPSILSNVDLDYTPIAVDEYGRVKTSSYPATTPAVYNVTMTNADTEYSQALPSGCRKFTVHCRDGTEFRLAFVTGKVATPTAPYLTVPENACYWEDNVKSSGTIYVACDTAGKVVEIVAWS